MASKIYQGSKRKNVPLSVETFTLLWFDSVIVAKKTFLCIDEWIYYLQNTIFYKNFHDLALDVTWMTEKS